MKFVKSSRVMNVAINEGIVEIKDKTPNNKTFHQILKPILFIAQCLGIFPVIGIMYPSPIKLRFSWISVRFLYSVICIIGSLICGLFSLAEIIDNGMNFDNGITAIFYTSSVVSMTLFIKLAFHWPNLIKKWTLTEVQLKHYPAAFNVQKKMYIVSFTTLILGAIEHTLSMIQANQNIKTCSSDESQLQTFFVSRYDYVFTRTKFAYWKAFFYEFFNTISTFVWNFMDIFLLSISIPLTELFERINKRLQTINIQTVTETTWKNIREDYSKITSLCRLVNAAISDIVFLSFATNLCFICAQLLHSIKPITDVTNGLYFFFSMIYLIGRTMAVTIIASRIHEASRAPLPFLFSIPGYAYCTEIGRFVQQISSEIVALTGMNFFVVRKEMVLSVAGTIITYELVLIQFNALDAEEILLKNETSIQEKCFAQK